MLVLKEFYTYLIRKKTNQHTSTPNCYEINFLKSSSGLYDWMIGVYANDIDEADRKLRKCISTIDARIVPIPFNIAGMLQYSKILRNKLTLDMFLMDKGFEGLEANLKNVKGFVGDQFILRSKQAKRLKKLLMKIETFEKSLSKNLLQDIVNELYHLGISPEQLE